MAVGSHTVTLGGAAHSGLISEGTVCERGSFTEDVQLRSVVLTRASADAASARAVVYADDGTLLAAGTLAAIPAGSAGDSFELTFNSPVELTASSVYRIGAYQTANVTGATSGANQHTHSSTPALCDWSEFDSNLYYIVGSDAFPTSTAAYEIDGAFSFDPAGISVTLTPATETDAAQPLARTKRKAIATVTETDGAQALSAKKQRALQSATETDTAVPFPTAIIVALATVTETDEARPITRNTDVLRYRVIFPTYPRTFQSVPIGQTARFVLDQAVSIVRINGTLRQFRNPSQTMLEAAGTEGVDWFIGGRIYDQISYETHLELQAAGFETEAVA